MPCYFFIVRIYTFEKNSHLSHSLQIGLCTGKDLCPSAWLELLGACKPFTMICLAGFGCVASHLVMFVGFFFRFLQSCSLWFLFVFSFKCYYRFYWFHKTTELFLFSAYSKDTSCASTLEHWKSAKVQISLLKAWIFMYIPLFSFLSQIRSHGLGIFSQWLWGVPVPVCSTINYLVLSQAVKLSFVLCGPQASSICIILSHARQKTIPWTDC